MRTITLDQIRPEPEPVGLYLGLWSDETDDKYYLKHELGKGWIFRSYRNPEYGHSGHHKTRREACWMAFKPKSPIYEFDSQEKLDEWLKTL